MPDPKGLQDLHFLLARPGLDVSARTLLNPAATHLHGQLSGADVVLDQQAKVEYRRRIEQLQKEIDAALAHMMTSAQASSTLNALPCYRSCAMRADSPAGRVDWGSARTSPQDSYSQDPRHT